MQIMPRVGYTSELREHHRDVIEMFQPVLHNWYNRGCGMYYPVCGMMHIKEPLLLIGMSSPCGGSGFPLSLSEWSFTICLTPYNHPSNVLSVSLNKTFPSFLPYIKWSNSLLGMKCKM